MENAERIYATLEECLKELSGEDLQSCTQDGTLAAELHAYYNQVGLKEGRLKPEYATSLSKQDGVNKRKNIDAVNDVVNYWIGEFDRYTSDIGRALIIDDMRYSVGYEKHRGNLRLEAAAESQHEQWRNFVGAYQKERITLGDEKFRKDNYEQYNKAYKDLSEEEKDKDRLIVAVVTDRILERVGILGYGRRIEVE